VNQAGKERVAAQAARRSRHQTTVCRRDGDSTRLVQSCEASKPRSATCVGRPHLSVSRPMCNCARCVSPKYFSSNQKLTWVCQAGARKGVVESRQNGRH
jgi:hypothetical protein